MKRLALWGVLALAGCSDGPSDKAFSGAARSIMNGATVVEAYRIQTPPQGERPTELDWWKWPMKSGPVTLDAATSANLTGFLLDDRTYYTGPPKACIPIPGVKFRFVRGAEAVSVLMCYECRQLMVSVTGGRGGSGDFDRAAPALEQIAKKLFPGDREIQSLQGMTSPPPAPWKDLATGIKDAVSVEAWLIAGGGPPVAPRPGVPEEKPPSSYFDYKEISGPVTLGAGSAKELTAALSGLKTGARPCIPAPGVKLKFNRPTLHPVWVFICFECNELFVYEGLASQDACTIDDVRSQLLAALKPLFPKDPDFQRLK